MSYESLFLLMLSSTALVHTCIWMVRQDTSFLLMEAYAFVIGFSGFFLALLFKSLVQINDYIMIVIGIAYVVFMYDGQFKKGLHEAEGRKNKRDA